MKDWTDEAWTACQRYVGRVAHAEYTQSLREHMRRGRRPRTHRYNPSEYVRTLCHILGYGTEVEFKTLKAMQGYASSVGV